MLKKISSVLSVCVVVLTSLVMLVSPASANTIDINNAQLSFSNTQVIGEGVGSGFSYRYPNIITVGGNSVDGIVTTTTVSNASFQKLDGNVAPTYPIDTYMSMSRGGTVSYRVDFVESGTDNPVTLQKIAINVTDIDSRQFVQFSGVNSYSLSSTPATKLTVQTNSTVSAVPVGAYRFAEINGVASSNADQDFWAQVKYDQASSINILLGSQQSGSAFFGVEFEAASWSTTPTTTTITPSSYTITYDGNTATSGSSPGDTSGSGELTILGNDGPYTKPGYVFQGWNTDPAGNGVMYQADDTITPTANMTLYAQWLPNNPELSITKVQTSVDPAAAGDIVEYNIIVTNIGNVTLSNIVIDDANATLISGCTAPTLEVGSDMTCIARHGTTLGDVSRGYFTNVASVDTDQTEAQGSNEVETTVTSGADMDVFKVQTSVDPVYPGDVLTFDVLVKNTGRSAPVTNVAMTDPNAVIDSCVPALGSTLASGQVMTCSVSHVVTQAEIDLGAYTNVAHATSSDISGTKDSNEIWVNIARERSLLINKQQTSVAPVAIGDVITYSVVATNAGNVTLNNVNITDPHSDVALDCDAALPATIDPGEEVNCVASHTITQADVSAKTFANTAYASATDVAEIASNTVTTSLESLPNTGAHTDQQATVLLWVFLTGIAGFGLILWRRKIRTR